MRCYKILIFFVSVLSLLALLSLVFPVDGYNVGGFHLRFVDMETLLSSQDEDVETAEEKLAKIEAELRLQFVHDSLERVYQAEIADSMAYVDTLVSFRNFIDNSTARIYFPNDDPSLFYDLFARLDSCSSNNEVVRILHYGDSQIESDRITGYIREQLQNKFGGCGVGLVPAVQPIPSVSVSQRTSDSIPRYIADGNFRQKLDNNHYGILAQMAQLDGDVTLSFATRNVKDSYPNARSFSKVRLLVGNTYGPFSANLTSGKINLTKNIEEPTAELKVLTWDLDTTMSKFSLRLSGDAEIYGVSMDGDYGVAVDNIPLRGSSGTFFTSISKDLLSSAMQQLNVRLNILEFGGNATAYMASDSLIMSYKNKISRQISYLKRIYPSAEILFVGPADMSKKINGELQTYPNLESVVKCLKEAALENGAAFWSMYDVMGGKNAMIKWAEHQPAWASKDYIHFTRQGANRIAELFVQTFMIYYDYYHFLKRHPQRNADDIIMKLK